MLNKMKKLISAIKIKPYILLVSMIIVALILSGYLGYYIGIKTFKPMNNQCPVCKECEECKQCEICDVNNEDNNNYEEIDPLIDLGAFTNDNKEKMAKRYLMILNDISDNVGLVANATINDKEQVFRNYAYRSETIIDIDAKESKNMGLINEDQYNFLAEDGTDQCVKLSQDTFKSYYKVIFGEKDLKNASKNLPNWKLINGYYYFSDTNTPPDGGLEITVFKDVKINSNSVEISYLFGLFNDSDGNYTCSGKTYTYDEVEALGWLNDVDTYSDAAPIAKCGSLKKLILNKNSDGTYYLYKIEKIG